MIKYEGKTNKGRAGMNIVSTTVMDEKRIARLFRHFWSKRIAIWILLGIATAVSLLSIVITVFGEEFEAQKLISPIIIITFDALIPLYCFGITPLTAKRSPLMDSVYTLEFGEENIKTNIASSSMNSTGELEYSMIIKVDENKTDMYLYITKNQAYIVDKAKLEGGTAEELKAFLKDKGIKVK